MKKNLQLNVKISVTSSVISRKTLIFDIFYYQLDYGFIYHKQEVNDYFTALKRKFMYMYQQHIDFYL